MKDLIIDKIDTAIKKLKNAKMWLREQKEWEESLNGIVEDDLVAAQDHIDSALNDLDLYEQSFNKNNLNDTA